MTKGTVETPKHCRHARRFGNTGWRRGLPTMAAMKHIVVAGAGKIGVTIADMLAASGDYRVTLADRAVGRFAGLNPADHTRPKWTLPIRAA